MELRELLDQLWQRRVLVIGSFTVINIFLILYLFFVQPSYQVSSLVLLRRSEAAPTLFASMGLTHSTIQQNTPGSTDQENFILLATTKPYLETMIRKLDLKRDRVSDYILNNLLKLRIKIDRKTITPEELQKPSPLRIFFPRPSVSSKQHGDSNIFSITAKSTRADEAVEMANTLADIIIAGEREMIRQDFEEARNLLIAHKPEIEALLNATLATVKAHKRSNGTVQAEQEIEDLLTQISSLQENKASNQVALEKARAEQAALLSQLDSIKKSRITMSNNPATEHIDELKKQLMSEQIDLAKAQSQYTAEHPEMIAQREQIDMIYQQLKRELSELFSAENLFGGDSFNTVSEQLATSMANVAQMESATNALQQAELLMRNSLLEKMEAYYDLLPMGVAEESVQAQYKNYHTTMARLTLLELGTIASIRVVEPAVIPSKISYIQKPNPYLVAFLGIFLGTLASLSLGLVSIFLDDTLQSHTQLPSDSCRYLHAAIPRFRRLQQSSLQALTERRDISSSFQKIAFEVEFRMLSSAPIVAVTSLLPGAGRAVLASGLATALARRGRRVALVDFNFASDHLTSLWTGNPRARAQGTPYTELVQGTPIEGLDMLPMPLEIITPLQAGLLSELKSCINSLASRYDTIVIEMPTFGDESNLLDLLWPKMATLCVIPHRIANRTQFDTFDRTMRACELTPYFCIFNRYNNESFSQGIARWRSFPRCLLRASVFRGVTRRIT